MKVAIEMKFSISNIEMNVPIDSPEEAVQELSFNTQGCEIHGEHDFVLIPFLARYRAPIIDPELKTDFTELDEDEDFIDYCAIVGHCAVSFDDQGEVEHTHPMVMEIVSETYGGEAKRIWEDRDDDDCLNVSCKLDEEDMEEIAEFVENWLQENPAIKKAILSEYRKRSFKGKTPGSTARQ